MTIAQSLETLAVLEADVLSVDDQERPPSAKQKELVMSEDTLSRDIDLP
jgi:hypothetical protein